MNATWRKAQRMANFEWNCRFCGAHQVVTDNTSDVQEHLIRIGSTKFGHVGLRVVGIRCANPTCNEITLRAELGKWGQNPNGISGLIGDEIEDWQLRPETWAKQQPDYIPAPLREDYLEACLIRDKSPKTFAASPKIGWLMKSGSCVSRSTRGRPRRASKAKRSRRSTASARSGISALTWRRTST